MAGAVWAELARRHGIRRDDRSTWTIIEPRGLGGLRKTGVFEALATPAVTAKIGSLVGRHDWPEPLSWGDPLVTFPSPGAWEVPSTGWHIDFPARGAPGSTLLLKWLGYLAPVPAGGGGTVVLSGSHRLVEAYLQRADPGDPGRSPEVREAILGSRPWLRGMDEPEVIDGVTVRVVELTGEPGDVVFMHPHLFHAPAPNRAKEPRLMVTGGLAEPAEGRA